MIICLKNSVAVVLGENSAEQKNSGKMSDNCLGVQGRHNSSHGDPERSQSSPCLHSEPKPLLALPSLAASHGAGWPSVVHLGSPKRNKHTNERAIFTKRPVPPPPTSPLTSSPPSASQHMALDRCLLRSLVVHHEARCSFSFSSGPLSPRS